MGNKKSDDVDSNPYANLDKVAVIQECRIFNQTPVKARQCNATLCKLLYLLQHGTTLNKRDATDTFFAVTKLYQSNNPTLRLLVYLAIKELCKMSDDVLIMVSSLTKDMTGDEEEYRGPAIRALFRIIDSSMICSIERYVKQAIIENIPSVASSTLVSCFHLMRHNPSNSSIVYQWANEIQAAISRNDSMVQYHALALFYQIRSSDRLSVIRLVQKYSKAALQSPYAVCYLIRIAAKLVVDEEGNKASHLPFAFIKHCLHHRSEMVMYEAAVALIKLPNITSGDLESVSHVLQMLCTSPKPSVRFAAVRTINKIASIYPQAVTCCNIELTDLINDQNRSIATLAIITLLKTGSELSVESLMNQITAFIKELNDEFKVIVVESVCLLSERYPQKSATLLIFLNSILREEGSYKYKKALVDTVVTIIEKSPEAKEEGLLELCDFIEDCQYVSLSNRILNLIGREGPKTLNPKRFIRFIYNRIVLEVTEIRLIAVDALVKFGALCTQLCSSIIVLLKRCLLDDDNEVRDRATFYLKLLQSEQLDVFTKYIVNPLQVSDVELESRLAEYLKTGKYEEPFDLKKVPLSADPINVVEEKVTKFDEGLSLRKGEKKSLLNEEDVKVTDLVEFSDLGSLFRSTPEVVLSEDSLNYNVICIKHIFDKHIVLQFKCRSNSNDQLLENVSVELTPDEENEDWKVVKSVPLASFSHSQPGSIYVLLEAPESETKTGLFAVKLKFQVRDIDPITGEPDSEEVYDDSYELEDMEIAIFDYILPAAKSDFSAAWDKLNQDSEASGTYALPDLRTIQDAVTNLQECLSLAPCEETKVIPEKQSVHTLLLSGILRGGHDILARIRLVLNSKDRFVTASISVRSDDVDTSGLILNAIE